MSPEMLTEAQNKGFEEFAKIAKAVENAAAVVRFGVWIVGGCLAAIIGVAAWVWSTNQSLQASVEDRQAIHLEINKIHESGVTEIKEWSTWRAETEKNTERIITLLEQYSKQQDAQDKELAYHQAVIDSLLRTRATNELMGEK